MASNVRRLIHTMFMRTCGGGSASCVALAPQRSVG
jgi:hypothetical protein